jgi:hypothetical protein
MSAPKIDVVDSDHCLAFWGNLFLQVWRDNPVEERTKAMRLSGRRFLSSTKGDVGVVVVVEDRCPTPSNEARAHTIAFLDDLRERGRGILLVFEGDGFLAAASRAVMVGMMMAARFPMPYKVSREVAEAEAFMYELMRQSGYQKGDLIRTVAWLRGRIPPKEQALTARSTR